MSHIHIPDGVLPLWMVAGGWIIAVIVLAVAVSRLRGGEIQRQVPLLGVTAALMLVGMSLEIVPIGYHMNLTVLAGIILGPALGFVAAFLVDLFLALFAHGGLTVVGLNSLVIGTEVVLGYFTFRLLSRSLGGMLKAPGRIAALATFMTLLLATLFLISIVAISNVQPAEQIEPGALDPATLSFRNPFGEGILAFEESEAAGEEPSEIIGFDTFVKLVLILGFIGWVIEGAITGLIVGFIARVKPDLVRAPTQTQKRK